MTRPPLVLTGGPAVGKTVTAHHLATSRARCAVIDVDDVRQLIVSGGVAPWNGDEGVRQRHLGVANAGALAANFRASGFEVIIADVLTPDTAGQYRRLTSHPPDVDRQLRVGDLDEIAQAAAVEAQWLHARSR